jgi:hypothetical protein
MRDPRRSKLLDKARRLDMVRAHRAKDHGSDEQDGNTKHRCNGTQFVLFDKFIAK